MLTVVRTSTRDHRVSICMDDETPPFAFAIVEGTAQVVDDLDELRRWATRIAERYMGAELAESYGARNGVPGELLVRGHADVDRSAGGDCGVMRGWWGAVVAAWGLVQAGIAE